jgi:TM2 domain-containing membrane protein YozV
MTDDDSRFDKEGNVYKPNWAGRYEQQWDIWRQQPARDDSARESSADTHSWDGTALYRRSAPTSSSSDGGAAVAGGLFVLAIMGIVWVFQELRRPATQITPRNKSPLGAGLLSLFLAGGAGHLYLGQKKKGIVLILSALIVTALGLPGLIALIGAVDAYGIAWKLRDGQPVKEWEFGLGREAKNAYIALAITVTVVVVLALAANASRGLP